MDNGSGVGVLDKAALVLAALEAGPATLAGLVAGTGLARPTAHRLAVALHHGLALVERGGQGDGVRQGLRGERVGQLRIHGRAGREMPAVLPGRAAGESPVQSCRGSSV